MSGNTVRKIEADGLVLFLIFCLKKGHSSGCKFKTAADWKAAAFPWLPQSQNMSACELLHFMDLNMCILPFCPKWNADLADDVQKKEELKSKLWELAV